MRRNIVSSLVIGLVVLAVPVLRASDFVGVYCLADRVVLEPNDTEPQRVQIWGSFLMTDGQRGSGYLDAKRGYLYYSCPTGKDSVCINEWNDLKSVAGKNIAVGFGGRFQSNGRVRPSSEAVASPDAYPIQIGVARVGTDSYAHDLIARLKAGKRP
jgi:hypothetical protein